MVWGDQSSSNWDQRERERDPAKGVRVSLSSDCLKILDTGVFNNTHGFSELWRLEVKVTVQAGRFPSEASSWVIGSCHSSVLMTSSLWIHRASSLVPLLLRTLILPD